MKTIFCLVGPTAIGKSDLALRLAEFFPIEIISMDSAMVYRGMDIGTAKPSLFERQKVTHYLIDILSPNESFSVGDFFNEVRVLADRILSRGKFPLITGGSLMYFNVIKNGMASLPKHDEQFRLFFQERKNSIGLNNLHFELQSIDQVYSSKISVNDEKRIERGLEIYYLTGKKPSEMLKKRDFLPFRMINFYLSDCIDNLRLRIKERLHKMLQRGLVAEVDNLIKSGISTNSVAMQNIGYKQVILYLKGKINLEEMEQQIFYATSRLAKHQLTWLKKWINEEIQLRASDRNLFNVIKNRIELML